MSLLLMALSLRKQSLNRKLLKRVEKYLDSVGEPYSVLDLNDYLMPAYNQDIQDAGFPKAVLQLKEKIDATSAMILCSPEYNFSMPGHFKNTFDWISRFTPMPWSKKAVLFLSASPSLVGANRSLWHLRQPFEAVGAFVYPDMFSLAQAHQAFDEDGQLKNLELTKRLHTLCDEFIKFYHLNY